MCIMHSVPKIAATHIITYIIIMWCLEDDSYRTYAHLFIQDFSCVFCSCLFIDMCVFNSATSFYNRFFFHPKIKERKIENKKKYLFDYFLLFRLYGNSECVEIFVSVLLSTSLCWYMCIIYLKKSMNSRSKKRENWIIMMRVKHGGNACILYDLEPWKFESDNIIFMYNNLVDIWTGSITHIIQFKRKMHKFLIIFAFYCSALHIFSVAIAQQKNDFFIVWNKNTQAKK